MKKIIVSMLLLIYIVSALSADPIAPRFYKQATLTLPENGASMDVASVPVTYDLSSVKIAYIKMAFSGTDPTTTGSDVTDLGPYIMLKGEAESGRITDFIRPVYAYCRIVSTVPIVVTLTSIMPLERTGISENEENATINWQVYSLDGETKTVYFNGLAGKYFTPTATYLRHSPSVDGNIETTKSIRLYAESESFRGKAIGDYSAELVMTITSMG